MQMASYKKNSSTIAKKLILFIILFSSIVTLLATAFQIYIEYRAEIKQIDKSFAQIKTGYLNSIAQAVWVVDETQIKLLLNGITRLPNIAFAEIRHETEIIGKSGLKLDRQFIAQTFNLIAPHKESTQVTGALNVHADLSRVYKTLLDRAIVILLSTSVIIALVAIFIFILFSNLVTRHVTTATNYLGQINLDQLDTPLKLDRPNPAIDSKDELDQLATSINEMRLNLKDAIYKRDESEERFKRIVDNFPNSVSIKNSEGIYIFANYAYGKWMNSDVSEIVGKSLYDLFPKSTARSINESDNHVISSGQPSFIEVSRTFKDGTTRIMYNQKYPFNLRSEEGPAVIAILTDITEQKKAEAAIRESERQLREILENSPVGIAIVTQLKDIEINSGARLFVNSALVQMFAGTSHQQILDARIVDTFIDPDVFHQTLKIMSNGEDLVDFEALRRRVDGTQWWDSMSSRPVKFDGQDCTMIWHFDITARKEAEDALRQAHDTLEVRIEERTEQLRGEIEERKRIEVELLQATKLAESASHAKSEFLANMSHELRTPLNAIIGFSETLDQNVFGELANEKQIEYVKDIHISGQHLLDLINDILDVSVIEAGKLALHDSEVGINSVTEEAILLVQTRADQDNIELQNLIEDDGLKLRADERRLKQIMVNLLSNAIKYSHKSGEIKIDGGRAEDGTFVMKVIDNGLGMDAAALEIAMAKFGQVFSNSAIHNEGTGLGLPLTNGLVEAHGGALIIESELGVGTTVRVIFPKERVIT
jgi:PAS domain S-box-containing protein